MSVSEALRRFLEEHTPSQAPAARRPTAQERRMFRELFTTFGLAAPARKRRTSR